MAGISKLLKCKVVANPLCDEPAVCGEDYAGTIFSLFVPRELLILSAENFTDDECEARLKVSVIDESGDLVLIRLPARRGNAAHTVTVHSSQLESTPCGTFVR